MKAKTQLMLLTICVLALALINVFSVGTTMRFNEQRTEREQLVKQRLVQIRAAEEAYCRKHGVYTDRFDELVNGGLLADVLGWEKFRHKHEHPNIENGQNDSSARMFSLLQRLPQGLRLQRGETAQRRGQQNRKFPWPQNRRPRHAQ